MLITYRRAHRLGRKKILDYLEAISKTRSTVILSVAKDPDRARAICNTTHVRSLSPRFLDSSLRPAFAGLVQTLLGFFEMASN